MKASADNIAEFDWYVLRIMTGQELTIERWISRDGFATFCPVRREYRYRNQVARAKKRKHQAKYPLLPGYVFFGLSNQTPSWSALWRYSAIIGVIGDHGIPRRCQHRPLADLMQRHARGEFTAPDIHAHMATYREFSIGDNVTTIDGSLNGKVISLTGSKARVLMDFFGAERIVEARTENLVAA